MCTHADNQHSGAGVVSRGRPRGLAGRCTRAPALPGAFLSPQNPFQMNGLFKHTVRRGGPPAASGDGTGPHLSLRQEVGHQRPPGGAVQVAVCEDDQRGLAAQLQGDGFDPLRRRLHDLEKRERSTQKAGVPGDAGPRRRRALRGRGPGTLRPPPASPDADENPQSRRRHSEAGSG